MRRTLYAKLAAVLLALCAAVGAVYVSVTLFATRLYLDEVNQKLNRNLAATILAQKPVIKDRQIDWHMLYSVFDALMAVNPSIEIYLLDDAGNITAFSAPKGKVKLHSIDLAPVRRFLAGGRLPIKGDDPREPGMPKIFSAVRAPNGGYLYVILAGEQYRSAMQQLRTSWILQQSIAVAVGAAVFAVVAGLLLFASITRPLRKLAGEMDAFVRHGSAVPNPGIRPGAAVPYDDDGDEVTRLSHTFAEMADRITLQVQKLREVDLLRRELIANVSHDLRTPLASLQGYLDTLLLKEGQLRPEEQRRFIEIASKHSERLGKLVEELFELAKLDSQVTPIKVESFSMAELVQDVVQKFQLHAQQNGVALEAGVRPDLPLVRGDIALMERVLENLIDNAIRHTPAGGSVTVSLAPENGRFAVRVADTGRGISEEHLPHIFDRFYRVSDSATRGGGAGLGLAIAKRILELHGTTLSAESVVDRGTTFTFELAVAA
jgi:two-component system, OmpR family, sensor kinase